MPKVISPAEQPIKTWIGFGLVRVLRANADVEYWTVFTLILFFHRVLQESFSVLE